MKEDVLKKFTMRVVDGIYIAAVNLKLPYDSFCSIVEKVEDLAFTDIYAEHSLLPYRKKSYLDPVYVDVVNSKDIKEGIDGLSLKLRDLTILLEGHKKKLSKIKMSLVLKKDFLEKYKDSINNLIGTVISYNDVLMEMLECDNEDEMENILDVFLKENKQN